jgi:ParB family chromosome partitioning protein
MSELLNKKNEATKNVPHGTLGGQDSNGLPKKKSSLGKGIASLFSVYDDYETPALNSFKEADEALGKNENEAMGNKKEINNPFNIANSNMSNIRSNNAIPTELEPKPMENNKPLQNQVINAINSNSNGNRNGGNVGVTENSNRNSGNVGGELVRDVEISAIVANPNQPRKFFDMDKLIELADSIKEFGVVQPIILIPNKEELWGNNGGNGDFGGNSNGGKNGTNTGGNFASSNNGGQSGNLANGGGRFNGGNQEYFIVAGERRYRASKIAGLKTIPAIIKDYTRKELAEIAIIENLQREDLNPVETAQAIANLMKEHRLTQDMAAERLGQARSTITNLLRILELPEMILEKLADGAINLGHAKVILSIQDDNKKNEAVKYIVDKGATIRSLTEWINNGYSEPMSNGGNGFNGIRGSNAATILQNNAKKKNNGVKGGQFSSLELNELINIMQNVFNTKISFMGNEEKGRIYIDYYNGDDLSRIMDIVTRLRLDNDLKLKK